MMVSLSALSTSQILYFTSSGSVFGIFTYLTLPFGLAGVVKLYTDRCLVSGTDGRRCTDLQLSEGPGSVAFSPEEKFLMAGAQVLDVQL